MITIHLVAGVPEYNQIAEQIRLAVARGELRPGDRLEPVRVLADRLGIDPGTVARAYRELEREGVVETYGRRGTRVARPHDADALADLRAARLRGLVERAVVEALAQGFAPDEIEAAFGWQLAAWRERRGSSPAAGPLLADDGLRRFAGSHDLALEALWAHIRRAQPELTWAASYVGSLDGLLALLHGEVGLAGAHILDEATGEYNLPILRRLFGPGEVCAVTLAEREQGLIVAPGNPKGIRNLADLARGDVMFVNRQRGSGTRALLEHLLRLNSVAAASVTGYDVVVTTHLAVASAVAQGYADVGLGVQAAAAAFGLEFIPLARERYDLVCYVAARDRPPLASLFDLLASAAFRQVIAQLSGYHAEHTAEERRVL